jgi:lysophospholipase L1-like esterase
MKNQRSVLRISVVALLFVHTATIVKPVQMPVRKPEAADEPAPRADRNSMLAHAELVEKAKQGRIDVYFEGDSITRRWGTSDEQYKHYLANWQQNFFGWNAADFGWGGDKIQNILWRLNNGELDNVKPKIIVLLAGTNNVGNKSPQGNDDPRIKDITRGIKAILDVCGRKAPSATIVLMGITPRNDNMLIMPIINEINQQIAKYADGKKIRYLNINDKLAGKDGRLFEGMVNKDGLHLDVKGYQVWADALKPLFTELLGPPAKEDHAPPATGDPGVKNRSTLPAGVLACRPCVNEATHRSSVDHYRRLHSDRAKPTIVKPNIMRFTTTPGGVPTLTIGMNWKIT